ncbi:MAG: hypothetical protein JWO90_2822 [Solirubrobacterales bacterium]|nr:hypothetical protein [Solirubrobacterales bacterium]
MERGDARPDALGDHERRGGVAAVEHEREDVAADARAEVLGTPAGSELAAHELQEQVPRLVAEGVVDRGELVQADERERHGVPVAARAADDLLQPLLVPAAVRQAGERVRGGLALDGGARLDVPERDRDEVGEVREQREHLLRRAVDGTPADDDRAPEASVEPHGHGDGGREAERREAARRLAHPRLPGAEQLGELAAREQRGLVAHAEGPVGRQATHRPDGEGADVGEAERPAAVRVDERGDLGAQELVERVALRAGRDGGGDAAQDVAPCSEVGLPAFGGLELRDVVEVDREPTTVRHGLDGEPALQRRVEARRGRDAPLGERGPVARLPGAVGDTREAVEDDVAEQVVGLEERRGGRVDVREAPLPVEDEERVRHDGEQLARGRLREVGGEGLHRRRPGRPNGPPGVTVTDRLRVAFQLARR